MLNQRLHLILAVIMLAVLPACRGDDVGQDRQVVQQIEGATMGTYYRVSYVGQAQPEWQSRIDSLLKAINLEVSTYIEASTISQFNRSATGIVLGEVPHFRANLALARQVYEQTGGAYDPTVMPLVNYWGFGYVSKRPITQVDSTKIDSLLQYVGMHNVLLSGDTLLKSQAGVQLDFSGCAKGYAVDRIADWLQEKAIDSYLIDIGGESRAQGTKPQQQPWRVGINMPDEQARINEILTSFELSNRAVATSGNYRNWYEVDGVIYSHTINPVTGYPERTNLLSASVFHADCSTADAFATACMVIGAERSLQLADSLPDLELYLVVGQPDGGMATRYTAGLQPLFDQ